MREKALQVVPLIISALALLYLLFVNAYRSSFIVREWVVVTFDLGKGSN
jgi:hypothetical protein